MRICGVMNWRTIKLSNRGPMAELVYAEDLKSLP
jgi:hypothetical protein